jgi:hypothetical protein
MELQAQIVNHLRRISEPCNVVELAHALRILEPGDVVPERLRSTLTGLVRHQQIKRIHNGDGVLRYSLVGGLVPAPARIAPVPPPQLLPKAAPPMLEPVAAPRPPHRYEKGVSARVLAAFVPGEGPIRRTTLESRITPPLTITQVVMALQALRIKGKVVRRGTTSTAMWSLADDVAATAPAPAAASTAPAPVSEKLGAAHHALLQARLAIDAALQALEA